MVFADAGLGGSADSQDMSEHPHHPRDEQLVDRLEDFAFLVTLFSGAAIVVASLLLFVVL